MLECVDKRLILITDIEYINKKMLNKSALNIDFCQYLEKQTLSLRHCLLGFEIHSSSSASNKCKVNLSLCLLQPHVVKTYGKAEEPHAFLTFTLNILLLLLLLLLLLVLLLLLLLYWTNPRGQVLPFLVALQLQFSIKFHYSLK
jgi:hypothetical protein